MSGGGKRGNGVAVGSTASSIPAGSRKMVQSLKEIVNCSEAEIYAMLKECNMDPSEAVHRLLTQDTFHEVKSKREKKKEIKDIPESRSRLVNNNSTRGARATTDRVGRSSSNQSSSNDYGVAYGKPSHKKDNGTINVPNTATAGFSAAGSNVYRKPTTLCEVVSMQNATQPAYVADGPPLPSQSPSGFQPNWSRTPGQMSMADIVKMGRPQGRPRSTPPVANDLFDASHDSLSAKRTAATVLPSESAQEFHYSQGSVSQVEETTHELSTGAGQHSSHEDWPLFDKTITGKGSGSTYPETSSAPVHDEPSGSMGLSANAVYEERACNLDGDQVQEGDSIADNLQAESNWSEPLSDRQIELDSSGDSTHLDEDSLNGMSSYHAQKNELEYHEVRDDDEEISLASANLQQLDIHKGELDAPTAANNPAVIIPSHLQVTNADCSHLSFGSFGSAAKATCSGPFSSQAPRNNLEMAPVAEEAPSLDQNSRNSEYYGEDQLQATLNEHVTSRTSTSTGNYDVSSASQPEIVRDDTLDAAHGLRENFPSVSGYEVSATTQPAAAAYTYADPSSQMPNLSPFASLMQPYSSSLPSNLLAQTAQPHREYDLPFSVLLANQSVKYNSQTPSISGAISTPEAKQEPFSAPQLTPQALPTSNPTLPQHLLHPYSQPTLPLGHFANMISYPFLPQSYAFLPSASFPQAYTSNSPFQQSPAASLKYSQLPQYKTSSLAQSPAAALPAGYGGFTSSANNIAGYGGFTSSSNIPAGFSVNPSTAPGSTIGFEDALSSQYKEGSHYLPLQQNENSAMWLQGAAGSRAASALLGSTFYGIQPHQSQQNGSFRQAQQQQQPSQYGQMGYMNYYQSQGGPSQEQQQQQHQHHQHNTGEGNLGGSQGPASHQLWQQHGY